MIKTTGGITLWYVVFKPEWRKSGIWYEEIWAGKDGIEQKIATANTQYKTKKEATAAAEKRLALYASLAKEREESTQQ